MWKKNDLSHRPVLVIRKAVISQVKHNVHDKLGVHLIHSHAKMAIGRVMFGHNFIDPSGCWTRPTALEEVNLAEVRGHIFMLVDEDRFVAYEYVKGRVNGLSSVSSSFFKDFAAYVRSNGLVDTVGLQIRGQTIQDMVEFDFGDCGTVMLNAQNTHHDTPFRTTGWGVRLQRRSHVFQGRRIPCSNDEGASQGLYRWKARTRCPSPQGHP